MVDKQAEVAVRRKAQTGQVRALLERVKDLSRRLEIVEAVLRRRK